MVGQLAEAFGMKVLTYSRKQPVAEMETLFAETHYRPAFRSRPKPNTW